MVALIDCNNFFVSVERVFDPALTDTPVAVLSSNDGCIIARSDDIKPFIPMGIPVFKVGDILTQHSVVLKSSNFALYKDMSSRVMATLRQFSPRVDVYSIDEAFLEWPRHESPHRVRDIVLRDIGIPVSVGVAPTATLAKAAATLAKHGDGAVDFVGTREAEMDARLAELSVEKVWGVGKRLAAQFYCYRIHTARDLKHIPDSILRRYSVTVQKMVGELRGRPAVYGSPAYSQSMVSSRSFGRVVEDEPELAQALSSHAVEISTKLRREGLKAGMVRIFISTGARGRMYTAEERLPVASDDSRELIRLTHMLLPYIYHPRLSYKKAGVAVYHLSPEQQMSFDSREPAFRRAEQLNRVFDTINARWGSRVLRFAAEGVGQPWQSKRDLRSPRYTTAWSELRRVT